MTLVQPYEYNYCIVSNNSVNDESDKKKLVRNTTARVQSTSVGQSTSESGTVYPTPSHRRFGKYKPFRKVFFKRNCLAVQIMIF